VGGNAFAVQPFKTRVRGRHSSMEVTGIRINSGPNVSPFLYRQVRAMLHAIERFGHAAANEEHLKKYAQKQRKGAPPDLKAIVRGKIEFIGFVKGRDDRIYVGLLQRFQRIFHENAKPILIGSSTHESVIRQGIWLLKDKTEEHQGTAFAIQGGRLLTAAHNLDNIMFASRPGYDNETYLVEKIATNEELDLAEIKIRSFLPVQFSLDSTSPIELGKRICVVGFPKFHDKDSVGFRFGNVVQERYYFAVKQGTAADFTTEKHFVVDADIVKGNSGGPILDEHNRVIGVAVRGLDIPGKYYDDDQLSSFVPLHNWGK
jgi:RNA-directed DNA polymerase